MKLLLVEDDPTLADGIAEFLRGQGDEVTTEDDGMRADRLLQETSFDFVLLDLGLPGLGGYEVVRRIRKRGQRMPVILITARDALDDRIYGLDLGADDYLVKPFAFSELLARVRTLLRRGRNHEPETLRSANLELDLLRRRVNRCGQRIDLTAKEFALLELLLRRKGEVLPRSLIASQVWDMNFDSDTNVIEVAVRRLRVKVDDPFEPKLIHTVRGMGYVLEAMEPI